MDDKERARLNSNIDGLDNCVASARDYYERKEYGDAQCALDDLVYLVGKIIPSLEKLEDEGQ